MKKLNKYLVYVDNGQTTFNLALTATSKKSAMKALEGKGEIVVIKNLSDEHPISADTVRSVLQGSDKFKRFEVDWIIHALTMTGIATETEAQPENKPEPPAAEPKPEAADKKTDTDAKPATESTPENKPPVNETPENKSEDKPNAGTQLTMEVKPEATPEGKTETTAAKPRARRNAKTA